MKACSVSEIVQDPGDLMVGYIGSLSLASEIVEGYSNTCIVQCVQPWFIEVCLGKVKSSGIGQFTPLKWTREGE